jgi:drug/metabolite transporter (DMT)-like permease
MKGRSDTTTAATATASPAGMRHYRMGAFEWVLLIALAGVWGSSFFFNKVALRELPPFTLVWVRSMLAAVFLYLIVRLAGQSMNSLIPFTLISYGQTQIASGLASILNATSPLFTVLVAHYATRDERMSVPKLIGIAFGIAGVAVMVGIDALSGLGLHVLAQVAILFAALSYACASIVSRRLSGLPPMVAATGPMVTCAFVMAPFALVIDHPWNLAMPGAITWGAMLGLVVFCTAISYYLYFRILAVAGATNLMLVTFLIPVSALLLGMLVLDEIIEARQFGGMALICVGMQQASQALTLGGEQP